MVKEEYVSYPCITMEYGGYIFQLKTAIKFSAERTLNEILTQTVDTCMLVYNTYKCSTLHRGMNAAPNTL